MFQDNNILLFLFSILPALLYTFLIFLRIPAGSLKLRATIGYLLMGVLSITFIQAIYFIFPHWGDYLFLDYEKMMMNPYDKTISFLPSIIGYAFKAFVQVAVLEEICKRIACHSSEIIRGGSRVDRDSALATMFYFCVVSVGFAITENVSYAQITLFRYSGDFADSVILQRTASAIVLHMLCGLFMGYFVALGRQYYSNMKRVFFSITGIVVAVFLHGVYDFNLFTAEQKDFFQITKGFDIHIYNTELMLFCLLLAYLMGIHLSRFKKQVRQGL